MDRNEFGKTGNGLIYNLRNRGKMKGDWSLSHVTPAALALWLGLGSPLEFINTVLIPTRGSQLTYCDR